MISHSHNAWSSIVAVHLIVLVEEVETVFWQRSFRSLVCGKKGQRLVDLSASCQLQNAACLSDWETNQSALFTANDVRNLLGC